MASQGQKSVYDSGCNLVICLYGSLCWPLRQVLEPQSQGASLWDPLFFLIATDIPLAWEMHCPDMVLVSWGVSALGVAVLAWGAEAVASPGLQTCKSGWPWCRLQEQCRCVEGLGSYGIRSGCRMHRCFSMSALDILTASGQVIIWFALGRAPVSTYCVLRKGPHPLKNPNHKVK